MRTISTVVIATVLSGAALAQPNTVVVRPVEIHDVLVNPGMGIQTFQRFNGDPINPGTRWSEVGPEASLKAADVKPDFPDSSVAYFRWFWSQIEPIQAKYRWDILDNALAGAREHHQKLMIRIMPYDQDHPLPAWYQNSGARRVNKPLRPDGKIWQPDADDPAYAKLWVSWFQPLAVVTTGTRSWTASTSQRRATGAKAGDHTCRLGKCRNS